MENAFLPLLSIQFPSWLKPEIIPGLPIRWYGLMYIFAFATAFIVYRVQVKEKRFPITDDNLSSMFGWGILALILGARLFSTLIYETSNMYREKPWLIFWPFGENGQFTGLQGMSYHGGAFCCTLAIFIYTKVKKISFREIGDMFAAAIPIGYTFGRIGNFINAELYGRATDAPWGMVFPEATTRLFSAHDPLALEMAEKAGVEVTDMLINLPRHPSQLYEAFFEGIVLWALIWFFRNRKPFKGFLIGLYFLGYGLFRFFIEYFREPDVGLGYRIEFAENSIPPAFGHPLLSITTGQILCFLMILFGAILMFIFSRLPNREPIRIYGEEEPIDKEAVTKERNQRRKLRKKLK